MSVKLYLVRNGNGHWLGEDSIFGVWGYVEYALIFLDRPRAEREAARVNGRVVEFSEVLCT